MKVSREGVPELRLTSSQIQAMENKALEAKDLRGYVLIALCAERGWRVAGVTGYKKKARYIRRRKVLQPDGSIRELEEKVEKTYSLPGLRREDVGEDQVAIHLKGDKVQPIKAKWHYVSEPLMSRVKELAAMTAFGERLVPWTEDQANDVLVDYARAAGVPQADRIHMHRLRHYFGTHQSRKHKGDIRTVKHLMDHKDARATMIYAGELTPEEEKEALS